jgi:hypothetical protein
VIPQRASAESQVRRELPGDDLHDWAVIGFIALGSSLLVWLPLLV